MKKDGGSTGYGSGEQKLSDASIETALAVAGFEAADSFAGEASHAAEVLMGKRHEEGAGEIGMGEVEVEFVSGGEASWVLASLSAAEV